MCFYRGLVGEAVMKVITGIFICETFKAASADDDLMIIEKERQMRKYMEKILRFVQEADESSDGYISLQEFCNCVADARVSAWLKAMDIDIRDAETVFSLLDDGDGNLTAEEIVLGFSR